ncbi:MAG: hypothetical protein HY539_04335 [Deltaproteobacteria bacterium]|nr:hypothetical protein [Deltaproteobacteria bacterium]
MMVDSISSPGSFGFVEDRDRSSNTAILIGHLAMFITGVDCETLILRQGFKKIFILVGASQLGASLFQKALFSPYPPLERTVDIGIESTVGVIVGSFSAMLRNGIDYLLIKSEDTLTVGQAIGVGVVNYAAIMVGGIILTAWIHEVIDKPSPETALGHPKEVVSLS